MTSKQQDLDYIIIKKDISHELQEDLFDCTMNMKNKEFSYSQEAESAPRTPSKNNLDSFALAASASPLVDHFPVPPRRSNSEESADIAVRRKRRRPAALDSTAIRNRSYGSLSSISPPLQVNTQIPSSHPIRQVKATGKSLNARYAGSRKIGSDQRSPPNAASFAEAEAFKRLMTIPPSKTSSREQLVLKPVSDMEPEYLDPNNMVKANHAAAFEATRLNYTSEETPHPLVLDDASELSAISGVGDNHGRAFRKRRLGRTRPSQCDAVLIGELHPNRPEVAAYAGEHALESASKIRPPDLSLSYATSILPASTSNFPADSKHNIPPDVSTPEALAHDLRSTRTSHKLAEQGRRSRINTALKEIEALLPEEIIVEGNNARNDLSVPGASKASTVEMAIAYIKNLQAELESSCQHFLCNIPGCCKAFHRLDLLQRHLERQ